MCRSKMATDASEPIPTTPPQPTPRPVRTKPRTSPQATQSPRRPSPNSPFAKLPSSSPSTSGTFHSGSAPATGSGSDFRINSSVGTTSASSRTSLSSLHLSLPEHAHIYDFSEIRSATNNFLAKRYSTSSSSSQSWRCELNGKDVIIFQRKIHQTIHESELRSKLSVICKSHHKCLIKLLGASISNDHIYLVYEFISGSNLSTCLRNPRNPDFTVLSTWMSRMQIATDLANGLNYIHTAAGFSISLVHKYVKSSGIIITEPSLNARICHFGAAELCSETERYERGEITEEELPELRRSGSRGRQFEGVRGYMSPEFKSTGLATQKSDVYAFGVVILELLSGEEPLKYKYDKASGDYRKISIIDSATEAVETGGEGNETVEGRLRRWVDKRLKDSFPVEVAEKLIRLVLECAHVDPNKRPDMRRVAGKISKLYLDSKMWSDRVRLPTDFSVSLAPR
ncbi:lysM domain receptor-like kinase 3 [Coffea eugenioides]|uniref:lysM domain receptor-like kinase 3 n=1 Tax=Coffea eugenioides TaxID=49369 RepID=UPI000F607CE7|nr:lysM domain receptor-like kinase 3 isoform X1 [Coffea eugenioides]XP_027183253.1 lysM domain receptor-like kinase 3 [Coffea eugenioides]